jgi:adenine-specific DNA-methyltransferase
MLMTTDPADLVLDPTCGSGTTAYVAEHWGRRWITCDTSRVALALAKQRIMTAIFKYYQLHHPDGGVAGGFKYETLPHVTLKSLAYDELPEQEVLYDRPLVDNYRMRVSGPFTVEAVPAPVVKTIDDIADTSKEVDLSIGRSEASIRIDEWCREILATGVFGRGAQKITFSRVEPLQGTEWLHADAETIEEKPQRVVISFGPDYVPLEQTQVARAIEEAHSLVPRPKIILFAAFQFDPEAAKDIDELKWGGVRVLRLQMNTGLRRT